MYSQKTRVNIFMRIFIYSIGIISITLLIGYLFNMFFLDKFYIHRKEMKMKEIGNQIEIYENSRDYRGMEEFIDRIRELDGIEINIQKNNSFPMMYRRYSLLNRSDFVDKKFKIIEIPEIGSLLLAYTLQLPRGQWAVMTTSLSVMNAHKHEIYMFNFLTGFWAVLCTLGLGFLFSKPMITDIKKLSLKAEEISDLKFPNDIEIDRNDEIGDLSRSLEKMSQELSVSINSLKSFVSNASHELKTPLSVLCTYAQELSADEVEDEEEKRKYYNTILKIGVEMKELVNHLLTLSKLDNPNYQLKREEISIKKLLNLSLEKYDFLEFEKDMEIDMEFEEDEVYGDPRLLKLALDNIILNALKYSPEGGIIRIYQREKKLFIENESEEGAPNDMEVLTEPFFRGKNAEDYRIEGTGLGLSIVKKALDIEGIPFEIYWEDKKFIFSLELFKKN